MTKKDVLSLACKIFGIYFAVKVIESMQYLGVGLLYLIDFFRKQASGGEFMIGGYFLPFFIFIFAALYFIKRSDAIADRLCGANTAVSMQSAFDKDLLQQTLFSAIGVFVIANALTSFIFSLTNLLGQNYMRESLIQLKELKITSFEPMNLTWPIIRLIANSVIGLYLILGSSKLVALIKKLQHK